MPVVTQRPLIRVNQRHWTGCAVAAIATVVGVSYGAVVKRAFGKNVKRSRVRIDPTTFPYVFEQNFDFSLSSAQIVKLIRDFGFRVRLRHDFDFGLNPAILTCSVGIEEEHCIVWDPMKRRFIDPASPILDERRTYIRQWNRAGRETFIVSPQ